MRFYSKRGNVIVIDSSQVLNEIFYGLTQKPIEEMIENYLFILQEDKNLMALDETTILSLAVDIVPNAKKRRMPYNFENFKALYMCLKKENAIPYEGEDLILKKKGR